MGESEFRPDISVQPEGSFIANLRESRRHMVGSIADAFRTDNDAAERTLETIEDSIDGLFRDKITKNVVANTPDAPKDIAKTLHSMSGLTQDERYFGVVQFLARSRLHSNKEIAYGDVMATHRLALQFKGTPLGEFVGKSWKGSVAKSTLFAPLVTGLGLLKSLFRGQHIGTDIGGKRLGVIDTMMENMQSDRIAKTEAVIDARSKLGLLTQSQSERAAQSLGEKEYLTKLVESEKVFPHLNRDTSAHAAIKIFGKDRLAELVQKHAVPAALRRFIPGRLGEEETRLMARDVQYKICTALGKVAQLQEDIKSGNLSRLWEHKKNLITREDFSDVEDTSKRTVMKNAKMGLLRELFGLNRAPDEQSGNPDMKRSVWKIRNGYEVILESDAIKGDQLAYQYVPPNEQPKIIRPAPVATRYGSFNAQRNRRP